MSLHTHQQRALVNLLIYVAIATGVGAIFNQPLLFVTLTLLAYAIYQLKNLFQLHNWLLNRSQNPPDAPGYWGEIFNEINLMEKDKRINRKRLNKVLSRFQDAAQALPDGAIILTKNNDIEWANQSACTMLGIRPEFDIHRKISNLIRHPRFQNYLNDKDYSKSITLPRPMQPEHQLDIQIVPFGSNQKLILCRDITHVAQLEAMRTRFISNVSHELRSPLTVIKGYMEMLQEENDQVSPQQTKIFKNMDDQVQRMDRLVKDLLTLTRLETEAIKPNEEIDVYSLLTAIRDNARVFGKDKNQTINLEADSSLSLIGDNDELASLFTNLINNAVRYTPDKGKISIKWYLENENAVFSVTDTGPGIEKGHLSRLTERFYRVDTDRSRESGGTGLGLSIVKHILERHDGQLDIQSSPGKGSTFTCRFPTHRFIYKK